MAHNADAHIMDHIGQMGHFGYFELLLALIAAGIVQSDPTQY